jgi:hypothetical protein
MKDAIRRNPGSTFLGGFSLVVTVVGLGTGALTPKTAFAGSLVGIGLIAAVAAVLHRRFLRVKVTAMSLETELKPYVTELERQIEEESLPADQALTATRELLRELPLSGAVVYTPAVVAETPASVSEVVDAAVQRAKEAAANDAAVEETKRRARDVAPLENPDI